MHVLREDLLILSRHDEPGCILQDPHTGAEYEFGEVEHFLLERFRQPCDFDKLCAELNTRFGLAYTADDLQSFQNLLNEWGLLRAQTTSVLGTPPLPQYGNDSDTYGGYSKELKQPNRWHWFNPTDLFERLNLLFPALRWATWLTPIVVAVSISSILFKFDTFLADYATAKSWFGILGRLVFAATVINLATQIARGIVARHLGMATPSFGLALQFGLIPRFNVQIVRDGELDKRARLMLSATSTIMRFWILGVMGVLWAATRSSGTFLPIISIEFAFISFIGLMFGINPFFRGDGANFLSAWLGIPNIQQSSRRSLAGLVFGRPEAIERHSRHNVWLILFGLLSFVLFYGFVSFMIYEVFHLLESSYHGAGVALFLILGAYASFSLRRQSIARKAAQANQRRSKLAGAARGQQNNMEFNTGVSRINQAFPVKNPRPIGRYLFFVGLLIVLFLPYQREPGGTTEVFPSARVSITTDTDGVLEKVNFNGGEFVTAGTVLARLADYKQTSELRMLEADINAKHYEIQRYRTTPSRADIQLAEEKVHTARLQAKYSEEKLIRQEALALAGFISAQSLSDARSVSIHDKQVLAESIASLQSLKAQINPNQIQSLKANFEKLQFEADYLRELIRRTQLVTPIEGRIVATDLQYLRNSFLKSGTKLADVEDTRSVIIHILVPETDLNDFSIGAPIRLKLSAYSDREFTGEVSEVSLVAETTSTTNPSRFFKVTGRLNNPDGLLRTGLTGYAKIAGKETIVLLAFTGTLLRFAAVEMWSWLP